MKRPKQTHFPFYEERGVRDTFHPRDFRYGKIRYGLTFTFWAKP